MGIDKDSNAFTIGFTIIMVVVVATGLSLAAMGLKPLQVANRQKEKMQDIVKAIKVNTTRAKAKEKFSQYVTKRMIIDSTGELLHETTGEIDRKSEKEAFNIDVLKQYKNNKGNVNTFPLYKCEKNDSTYYVIPMAGTGLWGPIWGYISLKNDHNTVYGATFDHKTETPGLGAEIANRPFQKQFEGEKIYDENGKFVSVDVVKGNTEPSNKHAVDGITGGTITSHGVRDMMRRTLSTYIKYFEKQKKEA